MKTHELLSHLKSLDVKLWAAGDKLRMIAPKGTLTPVLRNEVSQQKVEILSFLKNHIETIPDEEIPIRPVLRERNLSLSFAQERLWFLNQLEPESLAYSMPSTIRIKGVLSTDALERTFLEMAHRHETMRTTFHSNNGTPVLSIAPEPNILFDVIDLQHLSEVERKSEAMRLAEENVRKPFDLACGPLFRVLLFHLGEEEHVMHINMHHIISDFWSFGVMTKEFTALYPSFVNGEPADLPELPVQYADYALWQRKWLQSGALKTQLRYWKEKLCGELPVLELPIDRIRPPVQTYRGASKSIALPRDIVDALRSMSRREGVTLFMTLLAAFKILLYRYTGQEDILVGTPIAGRSRVELEGLIGFFMNSIVLRTDLSGEPTFRELLRRVQDTALGAYGHQDMPFEKLVEELAPERNLSRTPLFQIFFNHMVAEDYAVNLPGLEFQGFGRLEHESKFDLTLYVLEDEDGIELRSLYNTDLFDNWRMVEMLKQYEVLLKQLVENPDEKISHYSLVTSTANDWLPDVTEPLSPQWEGAIHARFSEQSYINPNRVAVVDKLNSWTYGEMDRCSNQLANFLIKNTVRPGDVVAIYAHRSASLIWAMIGILKAGAAFLILDPAYPTAHLLECLRQAKPKGWLQIEEAGKLPEDLSEGVDSLVGDCRATLPGLAAAVERGFLSAYQEENPEIVVGPNDLAYVIFTSGTTGQPKGILGTHGPISHFLRWHCQEFGFTELDRFSMLSGLSHDPLLRDIFTPLWLGATLCIPDTDEMLTPIKFRSWIRTQRISIAHMTPALGQILTEKASGQKSSQEKLLALHNVFFGGDILTEHHVKKIREIAPSVECYNFYGTTETPQAMGYHSVKLHQADGHVPQIPLGKGIDGVQLLVINEAGRLSGVGELGEIHVRTPYLARGYLNDEKLTCERFISNCFNGVLEDRLYRTGDLGRYQLDGTVMFYGRADRQVSIRGFRVELKEIESVLSMNSCIKECAVVTREKETGEWYIVAYVVAVESEGAISPGNLKDFLSEKLPNYMIPSMIVVIESLPLTPNGKVNYQVLPDPDWMRPDQQNVFIPPRTPIENTLAEIWCKVLGLKAVGIYDNFFTSGGNSLLSVRLVSGINAKLNLKIPLQSLFLNPNVASLAKLIDNDLEDKENLSSNDYGSNDNSAIFPIQIEGNKRPLFVIGGAHERDEDFLRYLANLIPYFGIDQPVYGLRPRGSVILDKKSMTVANMAKIYIEKIRNIQKSGPYLILGECVGGIVAYELACQLHALGQTVDMLILMDTPFPKENTVMWYRISYIKGRLSRIVKTFGGLMKFDRSAINKLKSKLKRWVTIGTISNATEGVSIKQINPSFDYRLILYRYKPRLFFGDLTYICNESRYSQNSKIGWEDVVKKGFELLIVPGNHVTRLTKYGKITAQKIIECIEKSEGFDATKN